MSYLIRAERVTCDPQNPAREPAPAWSLNCAANDRYAEEAHAECERKVSALADYREQLGGRLSMRNGYGNA